MHCPAEGFTARASETDGKVPRSVYMPMRMQAPAACPRRSPRDAGLPALLPARRPGPSASGTGLAEVNGGGVWG